MKPAWYGGNKIPDSYLAKFSPKPKDGVPDDLRRFIDQLGDTHGLHEHQTPAV